MEKRGLNDSAITAILLAPDTKGLRPVYRLPAVRRLVILLHREGIQQIHIVGHTDPLVPALSELLTSKAFHPGKNGASLQKLLKETPFAESALFLSLRADLVLDGDSFRRFMDEARKGPLLFMPTEGGPPGDGIYLTGMKDMARVLQILWSPESCSFPVFENCRVIRAPSGLPRRAEGDAEGNAAAETGLVRALAFQTEAEDGFMARHVDRRLSRVVSSRLARTRISPNQITFAGMTIGLMGAFFVSLPGYWAQVFGALLFVLCVVVDGVDGEVARLKLMETDFGHTLDIVTDNVVHVAVFAAIAIGLYHHTGNRLYIHALMFLLGGFAAAAVTVYYCILKRTPGEIEESSRSVRLMTLMTNRDFAYLVLPFAAVHRLEWFLLATTAGCYLFAVLLLTFRLLEIRPTEERG